MNNGKLVICETCLENGKKITLGSVDPKGYFYVRRFFDTGGTTVIYAQSLFITHYCGFGTTVISTTTSQMINTAA